MSYHLSLHIVIFYTFFFGGYFHSEIRIVPDITQSQDLLNTVKLAYLGLESYCTEWPPFC